MVVVALQSVALVRNTSMQETRPGSTEGGKPEENSSTTLFLVLKAFPSGVSHPSDLCCYLYRSYGEAYEAAGQDETVVFEVRIEETP